MKRITNTGETVSVLMQDITGKALIEYPTGYREWISRYGLREETAATIHPSSTRKKPAGREK